MNVEHSKNHLIIKIMNGNKTNKQNVLVPRVFPLLSFSPLINLYDFSRVISPIHLKHHNFVTTPNPIRPAITL